MLKLARSSYEEVLDVGRGVTHSTVSSTCSSTILVQLDDCLGAPQPDLDNFKRKEQAVEESWLCHYMVAKCAEKEAYITGSKSYGVHGIAPHLLSILRAYNLALDALNAAGAKYPKKIIMYHKLPFRAVESIEVYYRIHALALKTLLHYGLPGPLESKTELPLAELYAFLLGLQSSEFVASAGKPKRGKKRTATVAGIANKGGSIAPLKSLSSQCTAYKEKRPAVSTGLEVAANDVCSLDPGTLERLPHSSSQDEFIDLTSPEPHLPMDDEECPPEDPHPLSTAKTPSALWRECVNLCRAALELVLQRLPLHYKAMFRLADLYCRAPHLRDVSKALAILLGPLDETTKSTIGGLFKDRKQNNFFHGVWRIPTSDIDRSGNFAAHMYRSVHLTLDLLHECGYWRHLVHVFHQLRKQPPEEKRGFLGESDRVYLAKRAFSLIRPTLMTWLTQLLRSIPVDLEGLFSSDPSGASLSSTCSSASFINTETLTQIYRLHCVSFSRNSPATMSPSGTAESKESGQRGATFSALEVSGYAEVLRLAFRLCPAAWDSRGAHIPIEGILKRCAEIASSRSASVAHSGTSTKTDSCQAPTSPATVRAV
ncbi:unnamed protein product [Dicrocoelium dendriticum]|nr:unnamed protein product [Dicrocoelium dendriticum]